jgi:hypothetical protein
MSMVASDMADEVRGWPGELRGLREGVRHRLDRGQRPG